MFLCEIFLTILFLKILRYFKRFLFLTIYASTGNKRIFLISSVFQISYIFVLLVDLSETENKNTENRNGKLILSPKIEKKKKKISKACFKNSKITIKIIIKAYMN